MPSHHDALHAAAAPQAVAAALEALQARGERVTKPRRVVVTVLAEHPQPLSADEIAELVEPSGVHRATVYRTLERLVAAGVASVHTAAGAARYHLSVSDAAHGHLHAVCRSCQLIVPLPVDALQPAIARARTTTGFELDPAQSVLSGLCRRCATAV
ncbi:MAG: Fur family transcriptional regulator [Microbacterium sp.]|uniref:Fur family transcriptional regulator n=1 Tax=Microbacterium sp. TaxID=51671 RepID=UPI003A88DABC